MRFFEGTPSSDSVLIARERSPSQIPIASTKKKAPTVSLPPTPPSLTGSLKTKDVVEDLHSSSSLELILAAREAYHKLLLDVISVHKICGKLFRELLDGSGACGEISERDDGVLCHPPWNTLQIAKFANYDNDVHSLKDMSLLFDVLSVMMDLGAYGQRFFSAFQFKTWYELLIREIGDVVDPTKDKDILMSVDPSTKNSPIFEVNAKALFYMRANNIHHSQQQVKCLRHISVTDCTFQTCWKLLPGSEMLQRMDCNALQHVMIAHLGLTNALSNIPCLSPDEIVPDDNHSEFDRNPIVRPEQKGLTQMMDLGPKFSKLGLLVLHIYVDALLIAKACLILEIPSFR